MKLFISMLALSLTVGTALAQNTLHYPADFPDRGREVLADEYAGATITHIGKGGKAKLGDVYYVTGTIDGKRLEMIMTKEGEVHEDLRVTKIAVDEVPEVCIEAALKAIEQGSIESAELVERGDAIEYRLKSALHAEADDPDVGSKAVVLVSPDGKVLENLRVHRVGASF